MKQSYYICEHCGAVVSVIQGSGASLSCCGRKMQPLAAGTVDASREKHVPVWERHDGVVTVRVGEAPHPMQPEHFIPWIALETAGGMQLRELHPGEAPEAAFCLAEDEAVVAVYAYCNLHGLWKS